MRGLSHDEVICPLKSALHGELPSGGTMVVTGSTKSAVRFADIPADPGWLFRVPFCIG